MMYKCIYQNSLSNIGKAFSVDQRPMTEHIPWICRENDSNII